MTYELDSRHIPPPIGTDLGSIFDQTIRWARLVGVRNDDCRPLSRCIIRLYKDGDVDGIPTGVYRTTAASWLCPLQREAS